MEQLGVTLLIGNDLGLNYKLTVFLVHKMGLGKVVVRLSLVVTEVSRAGRIR